MAPKTMTSSNAPVDYTMMLTNLAGIGIVNSAALRTVAEFSPTVASVWLSTAMVSTVAAGSTTVLYMANVAEQQARVPTSAYLLSALAAGSSAFFLNFNRGKAAYYTAGTVLVAEFFMREVVVGLFQ